MFGGLGLVSRPVGRVITNVPMSILRDILNPSDSYSVYKCVPWGVGLPSDAKFVSCGVDAFGQSVYVVWEHDSFELVPEGIELPRIKSDWHKIPFEELRLVSRVPSWHQHL